MTAVLCEVVTHWSKDSSRTAKKIRKQNLHKTRRFIGAERNAVPLWSTGSKVGSYIFIRVSQQAVRSQRFYISIVRPPLFERSIRVSVADALTHAAVICHWVWPPIKSHWCQKASRTIPYIHEVKWRYAGGALNANNNRVNMRKTLTFSYIPTLFVDRKLRLLHNSTHNT